MALRLFSMCILFSVSFATTGSDTPLPAWLTGCWEQRSENRLYEEQWMAPAAGVMLGMSRMIINERLADSEFLQLVLDRETNRLSYIALPSRQARTEFLLVSQEEGRLVFENLQHDFPQRILYSLRGDTLHARIEGESNGKSRGIDFVMKRVQCAPQTTALQQSAPQQEL